MNVSISNKVYEYAKYFVQMVIPAFITLYVTLASVWNLPAPDKVSATAAAVALFLGVLLKISSSTYYNSDAPYNGNLVVIDRPGGGVTGSLEVDDLIEALETKDSVTLRVVRPDDVLENLANREG